jgi:hypothetical protein
VATIDETSLACIIFDLVNADEIIAYAGHFVIQKNFLFDPVSREPVISDLSLLDSKICQYFLLEFLLLIITFNLFYCHISRSKSLDSFCFGKSTSSAVSRLLSSHV